MPAMSTTELRPMGIGEILDTVFRLYKRRFATFAAIAAVVYVPYAFLMAILTSLARSVTPAPPEGGDNGFFNVSASLPGLVDAARLHAMGSTFTARMALGDFASSMVGMLTIALTTIVALLLFMSLVYPLAAGALTVNISALYLGEELGAAESFGRVFRRLGHLLFAQFLATVVTFFGFVFFIVPGVLALFWFTLVPTVALLEDRSATETLRRSRALMAGNLGKAFVLGVVLWLLGVVVGAVTSALIRVVPWPLPFIGDFLANLVTGLMLPLQVGAIVLFYYDLRIRKEGFDLQFLATHMDAYGLGESRGR